MPSESLYLNCPKCGATAMKDVARCPQCGSKLKKLSAVHWVGLAFASLILLSICAAPKRDVPPDTPQPLAESPTKAGTSAHPSEQRKLIELAQRMRQKYSVARNEIQKSQVRDERRMLLAQAGIPFRVAGWTGQLVELDTNSDGLGIVRILMAPNVSVGTWNNAISDIGDQTLIQKNSPVYRKLAELQIGENVSFSGSFVMSQEDHFKEVSITQDGSMEDPAFLFRFEDIHRN